MMRPNHWLAYPPNRQRAGRVGGAGTFIAAAAAGLIAGLSQHSTWTTPPTGQRASDSALNLADTSPIATSPSTRMTGGSPGRTAKKVPDPPTPPKALATDGTGPSESADPHSRITGPASAGPATALPSSGSEIFRPYVYNGPTGTATQTTSGPAGTTTIKTAPATSSGNGASSPKSLSEQHRSQSTKAVPDQRRVLQTPSDDRRNSDGFDPTRGDDVPAQVQEPADSASRARIAQALPPGFTPVAPRQAPSASAPLSPSSTSTGNEPPPSPTGIEASSSETAIPSSPSIRESGSNRTPQSVGLGQPRETGPTTSGIAAGSGPGADAALTPVSCPPAVADATCYQRSAATTTPRTNSSPLAPVPAALPGPASSPLRESGSALTGSSSSDGCQANGNRGDSNVRVRSWGDLSQLIMDRIQHCIDHGMSGGWSGYENADSSTSSKSDSAPSASDDKPKSKDDDPSSSAKKQRHTG